MAAETKDLPGEITPFAGDMLIKEQIEGMIDEVLKKYGRLDILVNNAGIMDDFSPVGEFTDEMFDKVMRLNLFAPAYSMRRAVKSSSKTAAEMLSILLRWADFLAAGPAPSIPPPNTV